MEPIADRKRYLRASVFPVAVVLATVGGLGIWVNRAMKPGGRDGGLRIAEEAVDFGTVYEQADFPWKVPIKNTSRKVIEITEMRSSCACASVQPKSLILAPGDVDQFVLHLDLRFSRAAAPEGCASAMRPFTVTIVPVIKGVPPGHPAWTIRGQVQRAFEFSCDTLDFDDSLTAGSTFPARRFQVRCLIPNAGLRARCDESMATVEVSPAEGGEWQYEVEVLPNAGLPIGEHKFPVHLAVIPPGDRASRPRSAADVEISLDVLARVYCQIRAIPDHLMLGGGGVGEVLEDTVTLGSADVPFTVARVECDPGESLSVEELRSPAEDSVRQVTRSYVVSQEITAVGIQQGEVRFFVVGDGVDPKVPVVMRVSYQGFAAPAPM